MAPGAVPDGDRAAGYPSRPMTTFDGTIDAPVVVSIESTRFCNLRCPMCEFVDLGTVATGPHMPLADFRRIVEGLPAGVERVQLTVTGEPLLTRDLDKMIEIVAAHGLRLDVLTNGMLLQGKVVDLLLPVLGRLQISFDGATKATFEAIRVRSDFDRICRNVAAVMELVRAMPPAQQPQVGFECTIMRRNIEELPAVVDLAADLGVHRLACHHVHPFVERLREESLAHHVELAQRCIAAALERATVRGLPTTVEALGSVIADTSEAAGDTRVVRRDGDEPLVSERLSARSVLGGALHPIPASPRAAARARAAEAAAGALPQAMGFCGYLWDRAEIAIDGDVRACCVAGAPFLGNVLRDDFARIWNGPVYRTMRAGVAIQEPVAFCKGCQYLRVVTDPAEIRRRLGGRALPRPEDVEHFEPVAWGSPTLAGVAVEKCVAAPTLRWTGREGVEGYDVQFSVTDFSKLLFTTAWHGLSVTGGAAEFAVPEWVWQQAPVGVVVYWRAVGWRGGWVGAGWWWFGGGGGGE